MPLCSCLSSPRLLETRAAARHIFDEIRRSRVLANGAGGKDKGTEPAHILTYSLASCATVFTAVAVTAARPKHDPRNYPGIPRYPPAPGRLSYAQYMVPYSYIP